MDHILELNLLIGVTTLLELNQIVVISADVLFLDEIFAGRVEMEIDFAVAIDLCPEALRIPGMIVGIVGVIGDVDDIVGDCEIEIPELVHRVLALCVLSQRHTAGDGVGTILVKSIEDIDTEPVEEERKADEGANATSPGPVCAGSKIGQRHSLRVAIVPFQEVAAVRMETHIANSLYPIDFFRILL